MRLKLWVFWIAIHFFTNVFADDHWGTVPPVPKLSIEHDQFNGIVNVGWISDSTFDRPIWYIVEVKQVDENDVIDPHFEWFRPFFPIQSNFNEYISIRMQYKDLNGKVYDWVKREMFRIRAMWGA